MIVVHPDHVVGLQDALQLRCKLLVYAPVFFEWVPVEDSEVHPVMKQRP